MTDRMIPSRADDGSISVRCFLGFVAMIFGALLGWGLVELAWQHVNQGIHMWILPVRGWGYVAIAALCSLSGSAVGLALVRFRDLP
jgi:hypothetical protein